MVKKEGKTRGVTKNPTQPQPKSWDVPRSPAKGDAEKDTVFIAVGRALSAWETLESQMARIFGYLVSPEQDSLAARRAYGAVLTFRGRREMIDAAAKAVFFLSPNASLQKSLKDITFEVGKFAGRRNEIAHGKIRTHYTKAGLFAIHGWRARPNGYVLGPPDYATNKTALEEGGTILTPVRHAPSYAYSSTEIAEFQSHFERLEVVARDVLLHLWKHQAASQRS